MAMLEARYYLVMEKRPVPISARVALDGVFLETSPRALAWQPRSGL
jgi:hypothetical protein